MSTRAGETARIRRLWDSTADVYDATFTPALADGHRAVLGLLGDLRGRPALDLGCGTGRLAELMCGGGARVTAVDLAPAMVAAARRRLAATGADARVEVMDAQALDLPDAAFAACGAAFSLMFCPDPGAALREARRVLAPGGRLVMVVWGRPEECETVTVGRVAASFAEGPPPDGPNGQSLGDPALLAGLLADAGFRAVVLRRRVLRLRYPGPDAMWAAVRHVYGERIPPERLAAAEAATRAEMARVGLPPVNAAWLVTAAAGAG